MKLESKVTYKVTTSTTEQKACESAFCFLGDIISTMTNTELTDIVNQSTGEVLTLEEIKSALNVLDCLFTGNQFEIQ